MNSKSVDREDFKSEGQRWKKHLSSGCLVVNFSSDLFFLIKTEENQKNLNKIVIRDRNTTVVWELGRALYAISAYHHWCCEFQSRSGRGVQHYVIMFASFLHQSNWPPRYNWNIVESGVKHHKTNKSLSRSYQTCVWPTPFATLRMLRHFMTVRFVNNFRTLGNMFLSSIYMWYMWQKEKWVLFSESDSDILRYFHLLRKHCWSVWEFDMLLNDGHIVV